MGEKEVNRGDKGRSDSVMSHPVCGAQQHLSLRAPLSPSSPSVCFVVTATTEMTGGRSQGPQLIKIDF